MTMPPPIALTPADLTRELRLGDTDEETAIATRLLATASQIVTDRAGSAPLPSG